MLSRKRIPVWIGIVLLSCMFLMGQGGWEPPDTGTPPAISNLWQSRYSAYIGEGGGVVLVTVEMNFVDPDGDVDFVRAAGNECGTGPWLFYDYDIIGAEGLTSGIIQFVMAVDTLLCPPVVNDTIEYSVFDKQGNRSNILHSYFMFY